MRMLLEAGADANVAATEERGSFTALHYTCDRLRTEMITHLLKHGADPNLVDCNKRTPLAIIGSKAEVRSPRMSERGAPAAPAEQAESVVQAASALLQTCPPAYFYRHSVAYENRLPPSLIQFVRAHARPT
ncbi:PREDICTED: uncharacterized protein LOC106814128 [Priapulus caudatus]|uniref:Uncharacterized protein LOC106814128 n=1 Tax=Priapulus caudatus TaxID=37621 RepID=A0ABM1ENX9_PRICU|nr:PREDICTED: uncharacterized protein LOC106814128 [Priapulus caudatus]